LALSRRMRTFNSRSLGLAELDEPFASEVLARTQIHNVRHAFELGVRAGKRSAMVL